MSETTATLRAVAPEEIEGAWFIIEPGLRDSIARSKNTATPERVKGLLLTGSWLLRLFMVADRYAGFSVAAIEPGGAGELWANLVFLYVAPGTASGEVRGLCVPLLEAELAGLGCTHAHFFSARAGGPILAEQHGYAERFVEYVKELPRGD